MATASRTTVAARLRVTERERLLYLDLGDPEWHAVEIGPGGWRIVDSPPVPILRTRRTRALPFPVAGGSLAPLRELLPVEGEDEWRIVVLWALAALRPTGPYPIIAWSGEQGTGKSFAARIMRRLGPDRVGSVGKNPRVTLSEPQLNDDEFKERAAILEYDACCSRAEAEQRARAELTGRRDKSFLQ